MHLLEGKLPAWSFLRKSMGRYFRFNGIAGGSALALLESPSPGLTPTQRELRQMVLDSVPAASSKLTYGHALDHLFAFSAGRPLTRALLMEYRASLEDLAP